MALAAMFVLGYVVVAAALDVILRLWFRSTGLTTRSRAVAAPRRCRPAALPPRGSPNRNPISASHH